MAINNEAMFAHRALLAMRILGVQRIEHRYWHFTAVNPHINVIVNALHEAHLA
jgi:hypothetical protein